MTRLSENEKLTLDRAKIEQAAAPFETQTVGDAFDALIEAVLRPARRAALRRRLERLDDRMLADIGLQRWEIPTVADGMTARQAPTMLVALVDLVAAIGRRVIAWQERRRAERELRSLDDRMLRDIGIFRADIPRVVAGQPALSARAEEAHDALDALRRWARSRAAAKELSALDSRTLNDIGMVRGDIDWVAEELAMRSLHPANTNKAPRVA
jgi:uncharacterized protein YjiS (DUF1127 family)